MKIDKTVNSGVKQLFIQSVPVTVYNYIEEDNLDDYDDYKTYTLSNVINTNAVYSRRITEKDRSYYEDGKHSGMAKFYFESTVNLSDNFVIKCRGEYFKCIPNGKQEILNGTTTILYRVYALSHSSSTL